MLGFAVVMALCLTPVLLWRRQEAHAMSMRQQVAEGRPWLLLLLVP